MIWMMTVIYQHYDLKDNKVKINIFLKGMFDEFKGLKM